jgi:hypothetical protein
MECQEGQDLARLPRSRHDGLSSDGRPEGAKKLNLHDLSPFLVALRRVNDESRVDVKGTVT